MLLAATTHRPEMENPLISLVRTRNDSERLFVIEPRKEITHQSQQFNIIHQCKMLRFKEPSLGITKKGGGGISKPTSKICILGSQILIGCKYLLK
jgi:hypothetical protein